MIGEMVPRGLGEQDGWTPPLGRAVLASVVLGVIFLASLAGDEIYPAVILPSFGRVPVERDVADVVVYEYVFSSESGDTVADIDELFAAAPPSFRRNQAAQLAEIEIADPELVDWLTTHPAGPDACRTRFDVVERTGSERSVLHSYELASC